MKPVIVLATGDPYGIGPEICLKAAMHPDVLAACRPLLVGDREHLIAESRRIAAGVGVGASVSAGGAAPPTPPTPDPTAPASPSRPSASAPQPAAPPDPSGWPEVSRSAFDEMGSKQGSDFTIGGWSEGPAVHDMPGIAAAIPGHAAGRAARGPDGAAGRASVQYVKQAVGLVRFRAAAAVVTAPISKAALRLAGLPWPGHTELLADLCGVPEAEVGMLFVTPALKVMLATVHQSLRAAIDALTPDLVATRLALLHAEHLRWFERPPRIGVAALNPHAGEEGLFGQEESEILVPAIAGARAAGVDAQGPYPADTLAPRAARGEFDAILALYHDQGTIAVKASAFGRAVNMTLGLPFLRTSVDHGTAWDIAGKGLADPGSLVEAIRLAARLAPRA